MYLIYSALLTVGLLAATPYWLLEMLRHGKYKKGLLQRLGNVPESIRSPHGRSIWIHAVSVGEVLAVSQLVQALGTEFPDHRILISTTTDTGHQLASRRFGAENVFYFPLDFRFIMRKYFRAMRPEFVVVAETEFWPNFLRLANEARSPVAIVNARISDRSFPGYRRWRFLLRKVLKNVNLFLAQTQKDSRRLIEIGAPADRVAVSGNLKFDVPLPAPPPIVAQVRSALRDSGPVLVCGSTVEGEEDVVLSAFRHILRTYPAAVMLLAPRRPERFSYVASLARQLKFQVSERSGWNGEPLSGGVLLIDTIGELAGLYALADIAFVGGSLVPSGGHSIIEPAQHGVAILVGPHTENFRDVVATFESQNAVRVVHPEEEDEADELSEAIMELLADENERNAMGRRALQTLQAQQGATAITLHKMKTLLPTHKLEAHTD